MKTDRSRRLFVAVTIGMTSGGQAGGCMLAVAAELPSPPMSAQGSGYFGLAQFNPCPGGACPDETRSEAQWREVKGKSKAEVEPFKITIGKLKDLDIYDSEGERIDEVAEVLEDRDGKIVAVTIEVPVGILMRILGNEVIVPLDQVEFNSDRNRLEAKLNKQQLSRLRRWQD